MQRSRWSVSETTSYPWRPRARYKRTSLNAEQHCEGLTLRPTAQVLVDPVASSGRSLTSSLGKGRVTWPFVSVFHYSELTVTLRRLVYQANRMLWPAPLTCYLHDARYQTRIQALPRALRTDSSLKSVHQSKTSTLFFGYFFVIGLSCWTSIEYLSLDGKSSSSMMPKHGSFSSYYVTFLSGQCKITWPSGTTTGIRLPIRESAAVENGDRISTRFNDHKSKCEHEGVFNHGQADCISTGPRTQPSGKGPTFIDKTARHITGALD